MSISSTAHVWAQNSTDSTVTASESNQPDDTTIVGGGNASATYPWMVSLGNGSHNCGGTLVASQWVLTARHCFVAYKGPLVPSITWATIGRYDLSNTGQGERIRIDENVIYNSNVDLAMVFLQTPSTQTPVTLGDGNASTLMGTYLGWGYVSRSGTPTTILQELKFPFVQESFCEKGSDYYCTGYSSGDKALCKGDSGGPLLVNGVQIGVVSEATKYDGECALDYNTSTKVSLRLTWIRNIIEQRCTTVYSASGTEHTANCESDTTPPTATGFNVTISSGTASLSVSGANDNQSGIKEVRYSAKWNGQWFGLGSSNQASNYQFTWNMCNSGVPNGDIEFGVEIWDNSGNVWIWSQHYQNPHDTKNYNCPSSGGPTPVPQSCTNIGVFDKTWAYFWSGSNCTGEISWFSQHDSNGPGKSRQKSAYVPDGKVLFISSDNNNEGDRGCLASSVQNLADIGWEDRIEWALLSNGPCPIPIPVTPTPDVPIQVCPKPGSINLSNPINQAVIETTGQIGTTSFGWQSTDNANRYQFQVSRYSDLSSFAYDYFTSGTAATEDFVVGTYYWRVRGQYVTNSCSEYGSWSEVRTIEIRKQADPEPTCFDKIPDTGIRIFDGRYCAGESDTLSEGTTSLARTTWNDRITSMTVANGYSALVYDDEQASNAGGARCITGWMWDFGVDTYPNTGHIIDNSITWIVGFHNNNCSGWVDNPLPDPVCYWKVPDSGVRVFTGRYCSENYKTLQVGSYVLKDTAWDDSITAITIAEGYSALIYENTSSSGGARCINGWMWDFGVDTYTNSTIYIDNTASRIDVFFSTNCDGWSPPPVQEDTCYGRVPSQGANLFTDRYCAGESWSIGAGYYYLVGSAWDNVITSITLAEGYSALILSNASDQNGGARCITWWMWDFAVDQYPNTSAVINDTISSIEISNTPDCNGWLQPLKKLTITSPLTQTFSYGTKFELFWDGLSEAAFYQIELLKDNSSAIWWEGDTTGDFDPNGDYPDAGSYSWRVRAVTADQITGPWSDWAYFELKFEGALNAPTNLKTQSAQIVYGQVIDVSWNTVPGANSYEIELTRLDNNVSSLWTAVSNQSHFMPGVSYPEKASYKWRVRAVVGGTKGPWSESANFTLVDSVSLSVYLPLINR